MPYTFNPFTGNFDNTPSTLKGDNAYSNLQSNSATWVDAYDTGTVYKANSASYASTEYVHSSFLPLTGGALSGSLIVNDQLASSTMFISGGFVGINTENPNKTLTVNGDISSTGTMWDSIGNSGEWNSVYTNVKANSASYATIDFTNNKFFPLTGGQITGNTRINGNVTIFGDLTSTGTQTFANTIFSTTSSLSVVHVGSGPAVWVGNNGSGDIASFYDMDQGVEVFHVGGANGDFPNVGVKTSSPNKDFTVNGEISATSDIWTTGRIMSGDQELASIFRPDIDKGLSVFNTVQTNSATNWNYQGTDLKDLSAGWVGGNEAFTNLVANSAAYLSAVDLSFLSVSANWNSAYNTVQSNSATSWNYQGTDLKGLSANWQDTYTTVQSNSASWAVDSTIDTEVRALTSNWQNTYTDFSAQSANNISVYTTVQTNSATYVKTVATTTPGTSSVSTIVAVSALPVSPDPNTLYIVI
jgi:hypothetical protein